MATFAKSTFPHAAYATFRPAYPPSLYARVLAYHKGSRQICVDLGCGHGVVARAFSGEFDKVYGVDPSAGMIAQAKALTTSAAEKNVEFVQTSAESLSFLPDQSVDLAVSGEAAHYFDYQRLFPELCRVMKPGGTLAFWAYMDHTYVDHPRATAILHHYACTDDKNLLGPYGPQPGLSNLRQRWRALQPPQDEWTDIQRLEYDPGMKGTNSGEGTKLMGMKVTLGQSLEYIRTWSSYHGWQEAHPDRKRRSDGGEGDVVDMLLDEMVAAEEGWRNSPSVMDQEVEIEWASALILARKL
ncbi:hypothetical protein VTO42DRAFT_7638 [Malbranchea cinnamomea]